jgi:hypothetical protein
MTLAPTLVIAPVAAGFRERRRERARLAGRDRRSAHLAELHHIGRLARDASALVEAGWVQNAWFSCRDVDGRRHSVTAYGLDLLAGRPVVGGCLVGAIVQAGGGLEAVSTQLVQRTLDLTWHTLAVGGREPVRWCPAPAVRMQHLRELTRWNDRPARSRQDVIGLLGSVERAACQESGLVRAAG